MEIDRKREHMKFVIQRVSHAKVDADHKTVGSIDRGFLVLIGVGQNDTRETADKLIKKMVGLRIFDDENGKPDLAEELYEYIISECRKKVPKVETGIFGAEMEVTLANDGPFTIILDSEDS